MKFKLLLAVVVVILIVGVVFFTDTGRQYAEIIKNKIVETGGFIFNSGPKKSFNIALQVDSSNRRYFYGQKYDAASSSLKASSIYNSIKIDGGEEKTGDNRFDMEIRGFKGSFELTNIDTVKIVGEANYIKIGDYERSREQPYQIEIEAIVFGCSPACSFTAESVTSNLVFPSLTGDVTKLKSDGSVDQIKYLVDEKLEVEGFMGNFEFKDSIKLIGNATQVRGADFVF